jgi:hypothetical protein
MWEKLCLESMKSAVRDAHPIIGRKCVSLNSKHINEELKKLYLKTCFHLLESSKEIFLKENLVMIIYLFYM